MPRFFERTRWKYNRTQLIPAAILRRHELRDRGVHDPKTRATRLRESMRRQHVEATSFLYAIVVTANRLRAARNFDGDPALRLDARRRLLEAIERCGGAPTLTDLAKRLRMRRQSVREIVLAVERASQVEVFPDPDDRRALQVALTPLGRRTLDAHRLPDSTWTFTLLNGLDPASMKSITNVLHVVTQRLEGYARDMRRRAARRRGEAPFAPRDN